MKILWSAQLHRATITIMQQLNSITSIITYCITIQRNLVTSVHHYSMMHNDAIIITTVRHFRTYRTTVTINKHPIKESKFNVQLNQSTLIKHITQIKHRTLTPHVRAMTRQLRKLHTDCKSVQQCTTRVNFHHSPKSHPGPQNSAGTRPRTDRHIDTRDHKSPRIAHDLCEI